MVVIRANDVDDKGEEKMNYPNKTITDIITDKRRRADEIERDCAEKMKSGKMISDCFAREVIADLRADADELEAAWKLAMSQSWHHQEMAELILRHEKELSDAKRATGNAAAMYDTLKEMAEDLEDLASRDGMRAPAYSSIFSIYAEKCRKALAEPPKNCDRFNNADEAVEYYADEGLKEAWKELKERIVEGKKYEFAMDFVFMIEWLFAKAKGVNDGSK